MVNERKVIENIKRHTSSGDKIDNVIRYVNVETLKDQHRKQPQGKARGIDGISKEEYSMNLDENLTNLVNGMKTLSYKPKPAKRVLIPKDNGKYRPLGMPSYEDRLVQGCMSDVLNAIYEPKFLDCSYGFR